MSEKRIRFLHCADLHMDTPFRDQGDEGYSEIRRRDVKGALDAIVQLSLKENVDFVLICGDLFEHHYTSKMSIEWISSRLESNGVPVVIIPGNHDPYVSNSWYRAWKWPDNVTILTPDQPYTEFTILSTCIYGIGFSAFRQDKPDLKGVIPPSRGKFNILMLHGSLDLDIAKQPYHPVTSEELEALEYDYYALGHFHKRRSDYNLKNAANPGSAEPLGFDETDAHGVLIVELLLDDQNRKTLKIEQRDIAQRRYVDRSLNITTCQSLEEIKLRILGVMAGYNPERDLLRITLTGRTDHAIDVKVLMRLISQGWLYFKLRDETKGQYDYTGFSKEPTLKGAFTREMLKKLQECEKVGDTGQILILQKALDLGLEALENGKIESLSD